MWERERERDPPRGELLCIWQHAASEINSVKHRETPPTPARLHGPLIRDDVPPPSSLRVGGRGGGITCNCPESWSWTTSWEAWWTSMKHLGKLLVQVLQSLKLHWHPADEMVNTCKLEGPYRRGHDSNRHFLLFAVKRWRRLLWAMSHWAPALGFRVRQHDGENPKSLAPLPLWSSKETPAELKELICIVTILPQHSATIPRIPEDTWSNTVSFNSSSWVPEGNKVKGSRFKLLYWRNGEDYCLLCPWVQRLDVWNVCAVSLWWIGDLYRAEGIDYMIFGSEEEVIVWWKVSKVLEQKM